MKLAVWLAGLQLLVSMGLVEAGVQVELDGDRLTLSAQNAPLQEVLQGVAAAAHFSLRLEAPLTQPITVEFTQRPLLDSLNWLLRDQSMLIRYTRAPGGVRVEDVQVIAPSTPPGRMEQVRLEDASTPAVPPETAPNERIATAFALVEGGQAEMGRDVLVDLIYAHEDPAVREVAMAALRQFEEVPLKPVATAALTDVEPSVRVLALALLADNAKPEGVARGILKKVASEDGDPDVRLVATALLGTAESAGPVETGSR